MTVITNRNNQTQLTFIVTNINAQKKTVTLWNNSIQYLHTLDLMKVKGISENEIKDGLIKGDLRIKLDNKDLRCLESNINLITFDPDFKGFLDNNGIKYSYPVDDDIPGTVVSGSGSVGLYNCNVNANIGDIVYLVSANFVDKADADDVTKQPLIGIVESKPTSTQALVKYNGEMVGFSGLISGKTYYLSITPGQFVDNVSSYGAGAIIQKIGFAKNSTTLVVLIDREYVVLT